MKMENIQEVDMFVKPRMPQKPVLPKKPKKTLKNYIVPQTKALNDALRCDFESCLITYKTFLTVANIFDVDPEAISIDIFCALEDEIDYSVIVNQEIPNPDYDQEMIHYNRAMVAYEEDMINYEQAIENRNRIIEEHERKKLRELKEKYPDEC